MHQQGEMIIMSIKTNNDKVMYSLLEKYNLNNDEKDELLSIITSIYSHDEFQKRMTEEFLHHDKITVGMHMLEETIISYLLSKKYRDTPNFELQIVLKMAMMHDLYTEPWQNNPEAKVNNFIHAHGFRHPIEAVINVNTWYPEIFAVKEDAKKLIDGIVHHMFPLPVVSFTNVDNNDLELRNFEFVKNLNVFNKELLINSSTRLKIGPCSVSPSIYKEGRIMSLADKIVSVKNFKGSNLNGVIALLNGHNKNLINENEEKNIKKR